MNRGLVGQTLLNQFRVDAFIAAGGMGAVYRVWDLKRNVPLAMKVLHGELAEDSHIFKRFRREANALKKLAHPNIVQFYGLYQTLDIVFLLERYVDGPTLKDILRQKKQLPLEETLIYVSAVGSAIGYAHANGVVHCDVKPGNVLIDQGGNIYLTDFGIARHAESTTTTMGTAGTAAYMAPEQIKGESVTPATDVYALGVMLFELLTGQRPFQGREAGKEKGGDTANERIRYAHLHLQAPNPRNLNPSISKELAQVIQKALDKNPAERYQSMQEFLKSIYAAVGVSFDRVTDRVTVPKEFQETVTPRQHDADISGAKPNLANANRRMISWLIGGIALVLIVLVVFTSSNNGNTASLTQQAVTNTPQPTVSFTISPTPTVYYTSTPAPTKTNTPMNAAYLSSIYTKTVEPRKQSYPADYECADKDKLYLSVGTYARTARYNMSVYEEILDTWDISAESIRALPEKEKILVYAGPFCSPDGHTWWFVKTESSQFGWVIEYLSGGYGHFFTPIR